MVQVGKKDKFFNHLFRRYVYDKHFAYQEAEGGEYDQIKKKVLTVRLKMKQVPKCRVKFI